MTICTLVVGEDIPTTYPDFLDVGGLPNKKTNTSRPETENGKVFGETLISKIERPEMEFEFDARVCHLKHTCKLRETSSLR